MTETEAFRTLGLDEAAPSRDIKAAYRILSRKYHPDSAGSGARVKAFESVVSAFRLLEKRLDPVPGHAHPRDPEAFEQGDIFAPGKILLSDSSRESRIAAARALSLSGKRSAWMFLREALRDKDESVALAAVRAVAMLSICQADDDLALLYTAKDAKFREQLIVTAETLVDPVFRKMLDFASAGADQQAVRARKLKTRKEGERGE